MAPSKDGQGCFLTKVYDRPGDTTLLLGLDRDGTNHLTVLNSNWSIEPKQRLKLDFRLSKGGYAKHFAVGLASDGKRGFVTSFEPKFPAYFASSHMLAIARGDVPVERLPLDGSGAAVASLRQCVAKLAGSGRKARRLSQVMTPNCDEKSRICVLFGSYNIWSKMRHGRTESGLSDRHGSACLFQLVND